MTPGTLHRSCPSCRNAEQHKFLVEWNDTGAEYANDRCLHRVFEEQVDRAPDAVAVVFEGRAADIPRPGRSGESACASPRIAGIGPGTLVGICAERSLEMVVGLMGILKAGGALFRSIPTTHPSFSASCSPTRRHQCC